MPSIEEIRATVLKYLNCITTGTSQDIAELYALDATLEDPVGADIRRGRTNIEAFYRSLDAMETSAEAITVRVAANSAAFHFRVTTSTPDGAVIIEPIDVMTFDEDGLIKTMQAHWGPEDVKIDRTVPVTA